MCPCCTDSWWSWSGYSGIPWMKQLSWTCDCWLCHRPPRGSPLVWGWLTSAILCPIQFLKYKFGIIFWIFGFKIQRFLTIGSSLCHRPPRGWPLVWGWLTSAILCPIQFLKYKFGIIFWIFGFKFQRFLTIESSLCHRPPRGWPLVWGWLTSAILCPIQFLKYKFGIIFLIFGFKFQRFLTI